MTLLQLVTAVFQRVGLTAPTTVVGNTDENVLRILALANEEGEQLSARYDWQGLIREETHTTLAAESQGLITTICGSDFDHIRNETFWNRTKNRPWYPVDATQWQQMKASGITGPVEYFRIRGNYLLALPTPAAGETLAFEWVTKQWCEASGGSGQDAWAADTDVARLPDKLMKAGLLWRWKQAQGLEYAEDFNKYESLVADAMSSDGAKRRINMGAARALPQNVPDGNWSI